jgi:hypothetical protein
MDGARRNVSEGEEVAAQRQGGVAEHEGQGRVRGIEEEEEEVEEGSVSSAEEGDEESGGQDVEVLGDVVGEVEGGEERFRGRG